MSAAENTPPKASSQNPGKSLSGPPKRPSLRQPPPRPESAPPVPDAASASPATAPAPVAAAALAPATPAETGSESKSSLHPIAPPSEPMQYRAIGLVRGVYEPSEEQLNRGNIIADEGTTQIDSVLLGRVTSLIKKHIDLEKPHLWVVYPRTRQAAEFDSEPSEDSSLHLQIVGVWEPDTLGLPGENPKTEEADIDAAAVDAAAAVAPDTAEVDTAEVDTAEATLPSENYFSVRGEVLAYDEDTETILVKIVQGSKRSGKGPKAFKVHVFGAIAGKTVGYFWEFEVERQGEKLMMTDGRPIRMVPPKKKKKGRGGVFPRRNRREGGSDRPSRPTRSPDKPRVKPPAPVKSNPL